MIFAISIPFLILPIVIYLILALDEDASIKNIIKNYPFILGFAAILIISLASPSMLSGKPLLTAIIKGNGSYYDLEVINAAIVVNFVSALIIGKIVTYRKYKLDAWRIRLIIIIGIIVFIEVISAFTYSFDANRNVYINEACRREISETYDEDDNEIIEDISYISIYNPNEYDCFFTKVYLSTDEDNLYDIELKNITIPSKQSYVKEFEYGNLDFSNSKETYVFLTSQRYDESIDILEVPALNKDETYVFNNSVWSIEQLNPPKFPEPLIVEKPIFDHEAGFYDTPFYLAIEVPENTKVYYTTDSSDPDETDTLYTGEPIYIYDKSPEENKYRSISNITTTYLTKDPATYTPVDKCFVLKAVAIDSEGNRSDMTVSSYFINLNKYANDNVISLTTDPKNLFDKDIGIYVTGREYDNWYQNLSEEDQRKVIYTGQLNDGLDENGNPKYKQGKTPTYYKKGFDSERCAHFELINDKHSLSQDVGIRIQGGSNRQFPEKRFSIYARKIYSDSKWFNSSLFDKIETHSIVLREGFINSFSQYLCEDRNIAVQNSIPVKVFLDGEYLYSTYMMDKHSEANISKKYGINEENVIIIENGIQSTTSVNNRNSWKKVIDYYTSKDLSKNENYDELSKMIDIQSYIDFTCINVYLANMDYSESKNTQMFCTIVKENSEFGDGRWKWMLYDMDLLTASSKKQSKTPIEYDYEINAFDTVGTWVDKSINSQSLFKALKNNSQFREQFVNTFMDLINSNFSIDNVSNRMQDYGENISWNNYFFINRTPYATKHLAEEFDLNGTIENVYISTNKIDAGTVLLNTITPDLTNGWSGRYYTDYPIDLSVEVNKGYNFSHWEIDGEYYSSDLNISVNLSNGGNNIYAVFD